MENLNQLEIQNIRHICGHATDFCEKINYYKELSTDTNITNTLSNICATCTELKTDLSNLL